MKEVTKPNDIFASVLLNPTADIPDMLANGVNGANTGLLAADDYKKSKFVQQAFTNKEGVFDTEKFNNVYNFAQQKYNELQAVQLYSDLNDYTQYNQNDIYAPIQSQKTEKNYEMKRVKNPLRISEGVTSLFGKGEAEYSNRELAQMHKVWDSENEKWLDYTAEDQGFLGLKYLGRKSLVYAKWDEDGVHFDKTLGREVRHQKGEWKTDDNGQYYTETVGANQTYGKEFVAYSDILSKEDSWANNIDFFDSDDKKKSVAGTIVKTAAGILPYLFPGFREVWGGITAAVALSSVLPTFAKMAEGVVIGDKETGFTKAMNSIENYFNKFDESHSDAGKSSIINFETIMGTIGDVYGQLYQMRAAASLSNLYTKQFTKAQEKSYKAFADKFRIEWAKAHAANPKEFSKNPNAFKELWQSLADSTPEMKDLIKKQSQLSKSLSLGYMAMTSSADVYEDAIQGGYDRRMAGLAGFLATAGQFGIMYNNRLGDWFLDATTGYKSDVSRSVMRNTLRPYYDKIAEASNKLTSKIPTEEKVSILSKLYTGIFKDGPKKLHNLLVYGGEELWKKGLIEGVEEVTEEAVMDATKGVFDTLSAIGIGKNAETASFGGWDNVFSSQGAQRYLMSFIGGTLGGSLFELQRTKIQPAIDAAIYKKTPPDVRYSLIQEIMNGNTNELLEEIDRMCANDTQTIVLGDTNSEKPLTRGEVIADVLKQYVRFVEGTVVDEGIPLNELTGDKLIKKVVRTKMLQPVIEESGLLDMISSDFTKMVDDFVALKMKQGEKVEVEGKEKNGEKKEPKQDKETKTAEHKVSDTLDSTLQKQLNDKKQEIVDFLNGAKEEEYLKTALIYLAPKLRNAALGVDKYSWTKAKYNVDYSTLQDTGASLSKTSVTNEYKKWKAAANDLDKFRTIGVYAFDELEKEFSSVMEDYVQTAYKDVRKVSIQNVLSQLNFELSKLSKEQEWREQLKYISSILSEAGIDGISLEDQLQIGERTKQKIVDSVVGNQTSVFKAVVEEINKIQAANGHPELSVEDMKNTFEASLLESLQSVPLQELTPKTLNYFIYTANQPFVEILTKQIFDSLSNPESAEEAKAATDELLSKLGFEPINGLISQEAELTSEISKYIGQVITPTTNVETNINLTASVIEEYLASENIIDDEIAKKIKQSLYKAVKKQGDKLITLLRSGDFATGFNEESEYKQFKFKDQNTAIDHLLSKLQEGLNQNNPIEEIVKDWLYSPIDGVVDTQSDDFQALLVDFPDAEKHSIVTAVEFIESLPEAELYNTVRQKTVKSNPLFEKLRTFGMKVFDGKDMTIFELLEQESAYMSDLPNIGEYIRQGATKEAIDNFIGKLELLKAVVIGMEQTDIDPEHQIAYNVQLRAWDQKWNDSKNADKYKTISTENVHSINTDIDLLINKLEFVKTLIETNTISKLGENLQAQENFESFLLQKIEDVGQLTIKRISVLPPKEEVDKIEGLTEKLAYIQHTLYENVQKAIKQGATANSVVSDLLSHFKINKDEILNSGLHSNGLSRDTKVVSEYDLFVWLVSNASVDYFEFLAKYKNTLSQETYKFAPFYVQELAAATLYSFAKDKTGIHTAAVEWLYEGQETPTVQKTTNIFFLNGIAGAGKTEAVMSLVKNMLGTNNIWVSAPNSNQASKLKTSLSKLSEVSESTPVLTKQELLERLLTEQALQALEHSHEVDTEEGCVKKQNTPQGTFIHHADIPDTYIKQLNTSEVPKYIFIDEATHFNLAELIAIDVAAKKYGIKILSAGDTLQKGAVISNMPSNVNDIFSWKSPALTISVRAGNSHKKANVDRLQASLREIEEVFNTRGYKLEFVAPIFNRPKQIDYYQTDSELHGDKLVKTITVEDLKVLKRASAGKTVAVIGVLDANDKIADVDLQNKLTEAGFTENDYTTYSIDDFSHKAVQGAEADYVIINQLPTFTGDKYQDLISFYTYLSRSLVGSLIKVGNYDEQLNLQNNIVSYTSDYELPGLSQQESLKATKIEQISKMIGDYSIEEEAEPIPSEISSSITTVASERSSSEPLTPDEERHLQQVLEDREKAGVIKDLDMESTKPDSEFVKQLFGYGFYNRTGLIQVNGGAHYSRFEGTHLDTDGLFGNKKQYISKSVVRGFIKFKNLLALYSNNETLFKQGLRDDDILDFFWRVNPSISNETDDQDRRLTVLEWLEQHLTIDDKTYIFAKNYRKQYDASEQTRDGNADANTEGKVYLTYGKRIQCTDNDGNIILNQYITTGAMPKQSTLKAMNITSEAYENLVNTAKDALTTDPNAIRVFTLDNNETPGINLEIRKMNKGTFTSLEAMVEDYGIRFDTDELGLPKVMLIDGTKIDTVEGITTFSFLHYIAQTEKTNLSYADRIKQLEKAYVETVDGKKKLKVSGYYFALGKYTSIGNDPYSRVVILQPETLSYFRALQQMKGLRRKASGDSGDQKAKTALMEQRASYMSGPSQTRLIQGIFQTLNCIDNNGNAIGDGVYDYISYIIEHLDAVSKSSEVRNFIETTKQLIKEWRDQELNFDMAFIRRLKRDSRFAGLLILDNMLSISDSGVNVKLLPEEGSDHRDTRSLDFDVDQIAWREFGVGYDHAELQLGDGKTFKPSIIDLKKHDLMSIGMVNHFLEMPIVKFNEEDLESAKLLSIEEAALTNESVDYTNLSILPEEKEELSPTTESLSELAKRFEKPRDLQKTVPSTKKGVFYKVVEMSDEEKKSRYDSKAHSDPQYTNGFQIRVGDTIQIYGDVTHSFHISWVQKDKGNTWFRYDLKDGKKATGTLPARSISAVVSREIAKSSNVKNDYYQSEVWKNEVRNHRNRLRKLDRIVDYDSVTKEVIEDLLKTYPTLVVYPVLNSDNSVLTKLANAEAELQEGSNLTTIGIYAANNAKGVLDSIKSLSDLDDLNGIVIAGLKSDLSKFGVNKLSTLKKIQSDHIVQYISMTDNPKLTAKVEAPKSSKKNKDKSKTETSKVETRVDQALNQFLQNPNVSLESTIAESSLEQLADFPNIKWFKYQTETGVWSVRPKVKALTKENLQDIFNSNNLNNIVIVGLQNGDVVTIVKEDGGTYDAVLQSNVGDNYVFEYTATSGELKTTTVTKQAFDLLRGYKYIIQETSVPTPQSATIDTIQISDLIHSKVRTLYQKNTDEAVQEFNSVVSTYLNTHPEKTKEEVMQKFIEFLQYYEDILTIPGTEGEALSWDSDRDFINDLELIMNDSRSFNELYDEDMKRPCPKTN